VAHLPNLPPSPEEQLALAENPKKQKIVKTAFSFKYQWG
jgi:hypothetical protein